MPEITLVVSKPGEFPKSIKMATEGCPLKAARQYEQLSGQKVETVTTVGTDNRERVYNMRVIK